ncbi:MAG: helicase [Lachnospiraceae bacterium]|nr:helicase [Lachnospiraceae bacterium]
MARVEDMLDDIENMVISGLKDFQKATVERIDYLFRSGKKRVLVSDEVGLGKTLIARGTVAKFAKLRKEEGDDLVKVVYICSNSAIADQNLNKLRITRDIKSEDASYSRLSMQHLNIFKQEKDVELRNGYIQLIPLTPDTSFRLTSGTGTARERALMFAILKRLPEIKKYESALEEMMIDNANKAWPYRKDYYEREVALVNNHTGGKYLKYMIHQLSGELQKVYKEGKSFLSTLLSGLKGIKKNKDNPKDYRDIVMALRLIFAKITLDRLEPDLVIMDEFQRFKYLLNAEIDSEVGMLADKFFNAKKPPRMLLLSATPYKMYSTLEEIDETNNDEHFNEFLSVMDFLRHYEKGSNFEEVWNNYSVKLKEFTSGDEAFLSVKNEAEEAMYENVCRTERISEKENADIIDSSDAKEPLKVLKEDIISYLDAQKVLDGMGKAINVPIDYVKSSPYLFSFMKEYKLKKVVEEYFANHPYELGKIDKKSLWISKKAIDNYEKLPLNNARLARVMKCVFKNSAELLLWIPPCVPYYEPKGVYENTTGFSKTLIFSSWEMVPRMISSFISYESERRTIGALKENEKQIEVKYFTDGDKRYPSQRLNFSVKDSALSGMSLFTLLYPSKTLAGCYDPIKCFNKKMSLSEIEKEVSNKIEKLVSRFEGKNAGLADNRWYYMVPILLDDEDYVTNWLNHTVEIASYGKGEEKESRTKGFMAHISQVRKFYEEYTSEGTLNLGKKPDDLVEVLTDMALASPSICVLRTYNHYAGDEVFNKNYLTSQIGRMFINRMNTPESTAVIEIACGKQSEDAHWKNVLNYCKCGNFQAMYDEYAHLLTNGIDDNENLLESLHQMVKESMDFRTSVYEADTFDSFSHKVKHSTKDKEEKVPPKYKSANMRSHFATAFTRGDNEEKDGDRKKAVRNAFNSPFRPFVLASTSIGQEGLDFHNYCRRIVHWNIPSNPIDLEQREGRINRFECLVIRQNVAKRYGSSSVKDDIWKDLFEKAKKKEKKGTSSDLIPYWGLRESEDMIKIERIVPLYPFSRDTLSYRRLIKILSLYRLTLGQARQEELLEYLFENSKKLDNLQSFFINLSPFYKK